MIRLILAIVCISVFHNASAKAQSIHWLYSEMPPAHILQGEHTNTGYADLTMQLLIDALPDYQHVKVIANYKRSLNELSARDNRCHSALLKSADRESNVIYSVPAYIISANKLFVHKDKLHIVEPYVNAASKVDLAQLLANESFFLGVSSGAKYGDAIDHTLKLASSKDNLIVRSAIDHYSGLSGMLKKQHRLDGFLGLTVEDGFFQRPPGDISKELTGYRIAGVDDFLVGYVGCSKSPLGQQLITEINKILLSERNNKIKKYYQRWLFAEDKALHEMLVRQQF